MIEKKGKNLEYLEDFRKGKIKQGLGIENDVVDKHIRFKKGQLVIFQGHDNVGKTYWFTWYALCLALKHNIKFLMYTGENTSGNMFRDLIQFYIGKNFSKISDTELKTAYAFLEQYFEFIDNSKLYKPNELFELFKTSDADACLIDPFTALDRDMSYTGNYEFLNLARQFCNQTNKTLYVSTHPNSEQGRAGNVYPDNHEHAGHLKAPMKAGIEGGKAFLNRCDDMFTVHRLVAHEKMRFKTEITIDKIKDRTTGGECTLLNEPILFDFNNGLGFTIGNIIKHDPLIGHRMYQESQPEPQPELKIQYTDKALTNANKTNNEFNIF